MFFKAFFFVAGTILSVKAAQQEPIEAACRRLEVARNEKSILADLETRFQSKQHIWGEVISITNHFKLKFVQLCDARFLVSVPDFLVGGSKLQQDLDRQLCAKVNGEDIFCGRSFHFDKKEDDYCCSHSSDGIAIPRNLKVIQELKELFEEMKFITVRPLGETAVKTKTTFDSLIQRMCGLRDILN